MPKTFSCRTLALITLAVILIGACSSSVQTSPINTWQYADLRLLDPIDAEIPSHDIIAVYSRFVQGELQLRLDLLEHLTLPNYDIYLAIDFSPGGVRSLHLDADADIDWDLLVTIPASGSLAVMNFNGIISQGSSLSAIRDPIQDTIIISILQAALSKPPESRIATKAANLQIFLTQAGSEQLADKTGVFHTGDLAPKPAEILFAFWNTYPAYSPALALRRWDGAHTGPYGGRHGLYNLLRTANGARMPLVLLDVKSPISLAALDYGGGLELVSDMVASGLLLLPEYLPDISIANTTVTKEISQQILATNRQISHDFGLPTSIFLSTGPGLLADLPETRFIFLRSPGIQIGESGLPLAYVNHWRGQHLLILPFSQVPEPVRQATLDGPSLILRQALLDHALNLNSGSGAIMLLGGDLPASDWGAPAAARATFRYIQNHPWIRVLNGNDLLTRKTTQIPDRQFLQLTQLEYDNSELADALLNTPAGPIRSAALGALQALHGPIYPFSVGLPALRDHYSSSVWSLLSAAGWAARPYRIAGCELDPDHDNQTECILASDFVYAQFDPEGAILTHLFIRDKSNGEDFTTHQMVAPSSQFAVGLSDPASWDLTKGFSADPNELPGAFYQYDQTVYQAITNSNSLLFRTGDGQICFKYTLLADGLRLDFLCYPINPNEPVKIPISLDPWRMNNPDWADIYQLTQIAQGWSWQVGGAVQFKITASTALEASTFKDSIGFFSRPENPNRDYKGGHFLVFPQIMFQLYPNKGVWVEFRVENLLSDFQGTVNLHYNNEK